MKYQPVIIFLFSSSVCCSAKLPAATSNALVRRFSRMEAETLGSKTLDLCHHRTAVPCAIRGVPDRTEEQAGTVH